MTSSMEATSLESLLLAGGSCLCNFSPQSESLEGRTILSVSLACSNTLLTRGTRGLLLLVEGRVATFDVLIWDNSGRPVVGIEKTS